MNSQENRSNNEIQIIISSDLNYENLVAEVYYKDKFVLLVSNEEKELMVEIPGPDVNESCVARKVPFFLLRKAMDKAAKKLLE